MSRLWSLSATQTSTVNGFTCHASCTMIARSRGHLGRYSFAGYNEGGRDAFARDAELCLYFLWLTLPSTIPSTCHFSFEGLPSAGKFTAMCPGPFEECSPNREVRAECSPGELNTDAKARLKERKGV